MKTVEIITVRMDPQREEPLLRELRVALDAKSLSDDRVNVEFYRHATVETDLSIHLRSETLRADELPSVLGRRLASALREFGPISHSVWFEEGRR
jgi:hypothetical protein